MAMNGNLKIMLIVSIVLIIAGVGLLFFGQEEEKQTAVECQGEECGGVCYTEDGVCCDDKFYAGFQSCEDVEISLIPKRHGLFMSMVSGDEVNYGEATNITITIENYNGTSLWIDPEIGNIRDFEVLNIETGIVENEHNKSLTITLKPATFSKSELTVPPIKVKLESPTGAVTEQYTSAKKFRLLLGIDKIMSFNTSVQLLMKNTDVSRDIAPYAVGESYENMYKGETYVYFTAVKLESEEAAKETLQMMLADSSAGYYGQKLLTIAGQSVFEFFSDLDYPNRHFLWVDNQFIFFMRGEKGRDTYIKLMDDLYGTKTTDTNPHRSATNMYTLSSYVPSPDDYMNLTLGGIYDKSTDFSEFMRLVNAEDGYKVDFQGDNTQLFFFESYSPNTTRSAYIGTFGVRAYDIYEKGLLKDTEVNGIDVRSYMIPKYGLVGYDYVFIWIRGRYVIVARSEDEKTAEKLVAMVGV